MTSGRKETRPYGNWESPITVESVISKARALTSPRVCASGRAFFIESKPDGTQCIVETTKDGLIDVLPKEYSAVNTVYEYGGSAYDVLPDGRIIFSNRDNTVHILEPDKGAVIQVAGASTLRYSNFNANSADPWVLAVQEDHKHDIPALVKNYVVAINTDTRDAMRVVSGADFYYTPQFSPDGTRLAWLEWDHPNLPFSNAKLFWGDWSSAGSVTDITLVAGGNNEGVAEPRWGPDGSLFYGREINGYRQLFRIPRNQRAPLKVELEGLEDAEFGQMVWFQGNQTYAVLSERYLVAAPVTRGAARLIFADLEDNTWRGLADQRSLSETAMDSIARLSSTSVLVIGSGTKTPLTLYKIDVRYPDHLQNIRESTDEKFDDEWYSHPDEICVTSQSRPTRKIYGFLSMPRNPEFQAPDGALPPLIISSHGGPTGCVGPGLKLRTQYFTSRGYAYLALNYTGSTGYGRNYREALFGHWGKVDADDAAGCAEYLVASGRVREGAAGISGISAGGYNVLQALILHGRTFAAGFCVSGISDVKKLGEETHKLESKYIEALVIPEGTKGDEREAVYRQRSPIYFAGAIRTPLVLLHSTKDMVVPIWQARSMAKSIADGGGDVRLIVDEHESHSFNSPQGARLWLEEEEKLWRRVLL